MRLRIIMIPNPYAYVGMSKSRFAEHFIFFGKKGLDDKLKD